MTLLDQQEMIQPDASQLDEITLDNTSAINPETEQIGQETETSFQNELEQPTTTGPSLLFSLSPFDSVQFEGS